MPEFTKISSKGQVVIPKGLRERKRWRPGTELEIVEQGHGFFIAPRETFHPQRLEDLAGILKYDGPPKTLQDMQDGIDAAMKERWERKSKR